MASLRLNADPDTQSHPSQLTFGQNWRVQLLWRIGAVRRVQLQWRPAVGAVSWKQNPEIWIHHVIGALPVPSLPFGEPCETPCLKQNPEITQKASTSMTFW